MDTFTRDGLTFDVTDSGPADGDVVLLLHGFPQDRHAYDKVAAQLNAAGLRTIAFDQRGYSPGARPKGIAPYGMRELVGDVLAAADAAGAQRFHVIGHDWGGAVAWALAERCSDRVISATVLATPHPEALMRSFKTVEQAKKSWYMLMFQLPLVPERFMPSRLRQTYRGLDESDIQRYLARFTPDTLTGPINWYRAMPVTQVKALRASRKAVRSGGRPTGHRSSKVTVPTTYIWGSHDFALGRGAAELTREFVSGDYEFIEIKAGHWLPELHADEVSEAALRRIRSASTAG